MKTSKLESLDCTAPGRGPWQVIQNGKRRSIDVRHKRNRFIHRVYYGTRTERTAEDALLHATALCAVLNAVNAKRP